MDKRELIIDALQQLFEEGKAGTASVSEIARKANIAKGGMYYYFKSKEEVLDALVERVYQNIINECESVINQSKENAVSKMKLLLDHYRQSYVDPTLDEYLHMPENAGIHQKSLVQISTSLSPIISRILEQGVQEGIFICDYPQQYADIIMSVFSFLLDPGLFLRSRQNMILELKGFADLLEKGLNAPEKSFSFLYTFK